MDEISFVQAAQADPKLSELADAISRQIDLGPTRKEPESYDVTIAFSTLVLYALYRWIKNYFDQQKGLNDLELVRKQLDLVRDELVADGVSHDKAVKIVATMFGSVKSKAINDAIMQSAIALLTRGRP